MKEKKKMPIELKILLILAIITVVGVTVFFGFNILFDNFDKIYYYIVTFGTDERYYSLDGGTFVPTAIVGILAGNVVGSLVALYICAKLRNKKCMTESAKKRLKLQKIIYIIAALIFGYIGFALAGRYYLWA